MSYDDALREATDTFVRTVAVIADETGRSTFEIANEAIGDSLARLRETGQLLTEEEAAEE